MQIIGKALDANFDPCSRGFTIEFTSKMSTSLQGFLKEYHDMVRANGLTATVRFVLSGRNAAFDESHQCLIYSTEQLLVMLVPLREVHVPEDRKWFDTTRQARDTPPTQVAPPTQSTPTQSTPTSDNAWFTTPVAKQAAVASSSTPVIASAGPPNITAPITRSSKPITSLAQLQAGKTYRVIAVIVTVSEPGSVVGGSGGYSQQFSLGDRTGWLKVQMFGSKLQHLLTEVSAGDVILLDGLSVQTWAAGRYNTRQGLLQNDNAWKAWILHAASHPNSILNTTPKGIAKPNATERRTLSDLHAWWHGEGGREAFLKSNPQARTRPMRQICDIAGTDREYFDILAEIVHFDPPPASSKNKPIDMYVSDYTAHPETRAAFDRFMGYEEDEWIDRTSDGPGGGIVFRVSLWDEQKRVAVVFEKGQYVTVSNVRSKWDREYGISGSVGSRDDVNLKVKKADGHPRLPELVERRRQWKQEREAVLAEREKLERDNEAAWEEAHGQLLRQTDDAMQQRQQRASSSPLTELTDLSIGSSSDAKGANAMQKDTAISEQQVEPTRAEQPQEEPESHTQSESVDSLPDSQKDRIIAVAIASQAEKPQQNNIDDDGDVIMAVVSASNNDTASSNNTISPSNNDITSSTNDIAPSNNDITSTKDNNAEAALSSSDIRPSWPEPAQITAVQPKEPNRDRTHEIVMDPVPVVSDASGAPDDSSSAGTAVNPPCLPIPDIRKIDPGVTHSHGSAAGLADSELVAPSLRQSTHRRGKSASGTTPTATTTPAKPTTPTNELPYVRTRLEARVVGIYPRKVEDWFRRVRIQNPMPEQTGSQRKRKHETQLVFSLLLQSPDVDGISIDECLPVMVGGAAAEAFLGVTHENLQQDHKRLEMEDKFERTLEGLLHVNLWNDPSGGWSWYGEGLDTVREMQKSNLHTWSVKVVKGKSGKVLYLLDGCRAVCNVPDDWSGLTAVG